VVLVDFLCANADIFPWSPSDIPGIPREVDDTPLISYLTPAPCNNGCVTLTKSDAGRSEWSYGSSSRPGSSRKFSHYVSS
jgi:hypothetical protein